MSLTRGVPRPAGPAPEVFSDEARGVGARPQGRGRDLLAATVADLEIALESRTRALALRRFLIEDRPAVLPARARGVAQEAWERIRLDAFLPAWSEVSRTTGEDGTGA